MVRSHVIGLLIEPGDLARPRFLYPTIFKLQKEASSIIRFQLLAIPMAVKYELSEQPKPLGS